MVIKTIILLFTLGVEGVANQGNSGDIKFQLYQEAMDSMYHLTVVPETVCTMDETSALHKIVPREFDSTPACTGYKVCMVEKITSAACMGNGVNTRVVLTEKQLTHIKKTFKLENTGIYFEKLGTDTR